MSLQYSPNPAFACYLSVLIASVLVSCAHNPDDVGDQLEDLKFTELVPPSRLAPPGTFFHILSESPFAIATVCPADRAFGQELPLRDSPSADIQRIESSNTNINLSAGLRSSISGSTDFENIRDITYTLSNVRIIEIDDQALFDDSVALEDSCDAAVDFRLDEGQTVSIVKQVLQADILYDFNFNSSASLSLEDKQTIVENLSVALGANRTSATSGQVKGEGLFWGVRDDVRLACRLAPSCTTARGGDNSLLEGVNTTQLTE